MNLRIRPVSPLVLLHVLLGCSGQFSAMDESHKNSTHEQQADAPLGQLAEKNPTELFQYVSLAAEDFHDTERIFKVSGGQFRMQAMRRRLNEEIAAYQLIESHSEATDNEQSQAILGQIDALSKGIEHGWIGYREKLTQLRDRLIHDLPGSVEAATVDAVWIWRTHFESDDDPKRLDAILAQHAKAYPDHPTGARLFAAHAQRLLENQQTAEAKRVCTTAAKLYPDKTLLEPVERVYQQIRRTRIAEKQQQAMLRRRAQQFDGHLDGYFVLFLHPKKLRYMSRVDYLVVRGLRDAIEATDGADAWELKGWFPDTKDGCNEAASLAEQLRKKNTISINTFGF